MSSWPSLACLRCPALLRHSALACIAQCHPLRSSLCTVTVRHGVVGGKWQWNTWGGGSEALTTEYTSTRIHGDGYPEYPKTGYPNTEYRIPDC